MRFHKARPGRDDEVLAAVDKLLVDFNDHPHLAEAIFSLGEEYYSKARSLENEGHTTEAKDYYQKDIAVQQKIIQELPSYTPRACFGLIACFCHLDEYEKAIKYCREVVDNWPDYEHAPLAQYLIGIYYTNLRNSGRLPEPKVNRLIEQAYKAVIEKYPDCKSAPNAALKLGRMSFKKKQWAEAAEYFEVLLERKPDQLRYVVLDLARAYEEMGELNLAGQLYIAFVETADQNVPLVKTVEARLEDLEGAKK
ncbi:MAG: tetratricopeptide repeat protein [Planctomycetes bacterium]|nr:tetratricopeptide repeat protein [Planctomycetota bacterium]